MLFIVILFLFCYHRQHDSGLSGSLCGCGLRTSVQGFPGALRLGWGEDGCPLCCGAATTGAEGWKFLEKQIYAPAEGSAPWGADPGTYRVASVWGSWEAPGSWRLSTSAAWQLPPHPPGLTPIERPVQIPPLGPVGIRETWCKFCPTMRGLCDSEHIA